jgi:arsenite methyltransferase
MSTTLDFDATAAAEVDAIYSTPDVAATRIAVFRAVNPRRGETALDIGCGPGYLLRELATAVGAGGRAVGVDISEPMLAMTRRRCAGIDHAVAEKAKAGHLRTITGLSIWPARCRSTPMSRNWTRRLPN